MVSVLESLLLSPKKKEKKKPKKKKPRSSIRPNQAGDAARETRLLLFWVEALMQNGGSCCFGQDPRFRQAARLLLCS